MSDKYKYRDKDHIHKDRKKEIEPAIKLDLCDIPSEQIKTSYGIFICTQYPNCGCGEYDKEEDYKDNFN